VEDLWGRGGSWRPESDNHVEKVYSNGDALAQEAMNPRDSTVPALLQFQGDDPRGLAIWLSTF